MAAGLCDVFQNFILARRTPSPARARARAPLNTVWHLLEDRF